MGKGCVPEHMRANTEDAYVNDLGAGMDFRHYGMDEFISECS